MDPKEQKTPNQPVSQPKDEDIDAISIAEDPQDTSKQDNSQDTAGVSQSSESSEPKDESKIEDDKLTDEPTIPDAAAGVETPGSKPEGDVEAKTPSPVEPVEGSVSSEPTDETDKPEASMEAVEGSSRN